MAQIIDESSPLPIAGSRTDLQLQFFTDLRVASNALAVSNLPGGFDEKARSGTVWAKGVNGSVAHDLGRNITAFASVTAVHVNYLRDKELDFFGFSGVAGIEARPSGGTSIYAAGMCTEEADTKLRGYYSYCGPIAGATARLGSARKFHVVAGAGVKLALGDRSRFARYREANAFLTMQTGGTMRFRLEPSGLIRRYDGPSDVPAAFGKDRIDYRARVELSLTYRKPRFEIGVGVEPSVNWSNRAAFRFWDVRGGPSLKVRF